MTQIPLFSLRSYDYTILLNEVYWRLRVLYNPRASQWTISIEYDGTEELLLSGIPMPIGIDLFGQFRPQGEAFGKLLLWNEEFPTTEMVFDNVEQFSLYYFLPDEDIPDRFNLVTTEPGEGTALVSKTVYAGWEPIP